MNQILPHWISGTEEGRRLSSRELEERLQAAVAAGERYLKIEALGQHGLGGRLWAAGKEEVRIRIHGPAGQRVGSMGFPNTRIEVMGPASDDVGWLNAGAEIVVHGQATNGVANAMAQGRIMVAGNIGARGMTMTKHNPRFDPPELWVLGSVGDYFAEFMAGGTAVICGHKPQDPANVLGYRPCVGMVHGRIFFRGPEKGFSRTDAREAVISDQDWEWLAAGLRRFLDRIGKPHLLQRLTQRGEWRQLTARTPQDRYSRPRRSLAQFAAQTWEPELGPGGLIGDLSQLDRSQIPVITTGELRRFVPVWENGTYLSPCQAACPTGMPVQKRWSLIREGRMDEAVDLALDFSPFPAAVCGHLCPNLCMEACTRGLGSLEPVDVTLLGRASLQASPPELPPLKGPRVAVIGAGPAGLSVAWQLRLKGIEPVVFDRESGPGGKLSQTIPSSRLPGEVIEAELKRVAQVVDQVRLDRDLTAEDLEGLKKDYDLVILAVGAGGPRELPVPGGERLIQSLDFLKRAKAGRLQVGRQVVIIGAGNVGCDAATEAFRLGAEEVTLIDIQAPASFGRERRAAEAAGARFRWPCFTEAVTEEGVRLKGGELLPAQTVIAALGNLPELGFLPVSVEVERGFIKVDGSYRTSDPKVLAIGDAVRPGLLTEAIGAGRVAARAAAEELLGPESGALEPPRQVIDPSRVSLEYFDPRAASFDGFGECAANCASCGQCRDCGVCEAICPGGAISRVEGGPFGFEMKVDQERCIGCGFCAGACPCGVWALVEAAPLEPLA